MFHRKGIKVFKKTRNPHQSAVYIVFLCRVLSLGKIRECKGEEQLGTLDCVAKPVVCRECPFAPHAPGWECGVEGVLGEGLDALIPCALLGTGVGRVLDGTGIVLGTWGDQGASPLCVLEEPLSPVGFCNGQGEGWFGFLEHLRM